METMSHRPGTVRVWTAAVARQTSSSRLEIVMEGYMMVKRSSILQDLDIAMPGAQLVDLFIPMSFETFVTCCNNLMVCCVQIGWQTFTVSLETGTLKAPSNFRVDASSLDMRYLGGRVGTGSLTDAMLRKMRKTISNHIRCRGHIDLVLSPLARATRPSVKQMKAPLSMANQSATG